MGSRPHVAGEGDAPALVQRQDLLRHHRLPAPRRDAAREDRTRRAAVSVPGRRDRGIRTPLPEPQGNRLGPGRAAQHGRAEIRAAQDSRSPGGGRDVAGRLSPRALEPRRGLSRGAQDRAGPHRRNCLRLVAVVALGSWLVRTRRVSPFGVFGRALRGITDPVVKPVERRLVRMGGNPAHAGGWLVVVIAVAGIVFLSVAGWFMVTFQTAYAAATGGPRATFALIIDLAYRILFVALIVRVVAAWFCMFRYSRWIRPAYILTDWLVEPIRRIVPNVGAFDFSPVVAVVVLSLLRQIVISALSR